VRCPAAEARFLNRTDEGTRDTITLKRVEPPAGAVAPNRKEIYILYQMGSSEEWTWFSPVGVFFSNKALQEHVRKKGIEPVPEILEPSLRNEVVLRVPQDYVIVKACEGEVPEVELEMAQDGVDRRTSGK
jgi:hypothetical protein